MFEHEDVVNHLGLSNIECVHVMDLTTGKWITHLRSSPAVTIAPNSTVHMKHKEASLTAKDVITAAVPANAPNQTSIKNGGFKEEAPYSSKRKAKKNISIDLTDLTESPN